VTDLAAFATAIAEGRLRVVDLTQTLDPDFPTIVLPPELGQSQPFRIEEISHYDHRGSAWYWNHISMGEHTGTHFDAPAHWITGRDLPGGTVDAIDPKNFIAPACVIDCSAEAAADADYLLEVADIEAWERAHGPIPAGAWALMRTDWSKRSPADYANLRDGGAFSASASRPSAPTPDRLIISRRRIPRTRCCTAAAATVCNVSPTWTCCRRPGRC
jgi:kynurenine formamidase